MSVAYKAVGWNRQKRLYDATAAGAIVLFLAVFTGASMIAAPGTSAPIVVIRGLGIAAIVLLHVVLAIGPACRLDRRLLPLLYNRRHLGVMMFTLALGHGLLSVVWYHGFGNVNPAVSVLSANSRFDSLREFPFELLGVAALAWLFVMAATSHDFWLRVLTPRVWKNLHMGVYGVYALLVGHVALGLMQSEKSPVFALAMGAGVVGLTGLHVGAGVKEWRRDRARSADAAGWVDVGALEEIELGRARTVCIAQRAGERPERVAVFRHGGGVLAVANVCRHQGGPLGEGRVIDGCITCPWHGYQYRPEDGCAPPPFDDKVATYRVRITRGRVEIDPRPLAPGTAVEPARESEAGGEVEVGVASEQRA